jgi:hypothetical protein
VEHRSSGIFKWHLTTPGRATSTRREALPEM